MMFLIKFGGSVITEKSKKDPVFRNAIMDGLSSALKRADKSYIIVHGAGSYGHVLAKTFHLNEGYQKKEQILGYSQTQALVQQLNSHFLESLHNHGLPAISIPPHASLQLDNHKLKNFNPTLIEQYLKQGFLPVIYGDVVLDHTLGFSICSGDLLMVALTEAFSPEKVIYVIDENGLYWQNPKNNPDAEFITQIGSKDLSSLTTSLDDHADVTGGMKGKIDTINQISAFNVDIVLLNGNKPDRLYDVLIGKETTYTLVYR